MSGKRNAATRVTCKKVLQNGGIREGSVPREYDVPLAVPKGAATEAVTVDLGAKLQRVFTNDIRHMVYELITFIGALEFGPLEPAQRFKKTAEALDLEPRQTAIERVGHAIINTEAGGRVRVIG